MRRSLRQIVRAQPKCANCNGSCGLDRKLLSDTLPSFLVADDEGEVVPCPSSGRSQGTASRHQNMKAFEAEKVSSKNSVGLKLKLDAQKLISKLKVMQSSTLASDDEDENLPMGLLSVEHDHEGQHVVVPKVEVESDDEEDENDFDNFLHAENSSQNPQEQKKRQRRVTELTVLDALIKVFEVSWKSEFLRTTQKRQDNLALCHQCTCCLSQLYDGFKRFVDLTLDSKTAYLYPVVNASVTDKTYSRSSSMEEKDDDSQESWTRPPSSPHDFSSHYSDTDLKMEEEVEDSTQTRAKLSRKNDRSTDNKKRTAKKRHKLHKKQKARLIEDLDDAQDISRNKQSERVSCTRCNKKFTHAQHLEQHMKSHAKSVPECKICHKSFRDKYGLTRHLRQRHQTEMEDSDGHEQATDDPDNKEGPKSSKSDSKTAEPTGVSENESTRKKKSVRKAEGKSIRNRSSVVAPVDCTVCGKTFTNQYILSTHMKLHSGCHACEYCGETFPERAQLRDHANTVHEDEKTFPCTFDGCERAFFAKRDMMRHLETHEERPGVNCPICNKNLPSDTVLQAHLITHTTEEKMPNHKCNFCGKKYPKLHLLQAHVRYIHERRGDFVCNVCGKTFGTDTYLRAHQLSHDNVGTNLCANCGKSYKHKKDLRLHERRVHSIGVNLESHLCPICGKVFLRRDRLRIHQVKENHWVGDQPPEIQSLIQAAEVGSGEQEMTVEEFKCLICGKVFVGDMALKSHQIAHVEAPDTPSHGCPDCGRKYTNSKSLEYHMRYMHQLKGKHACPHCNKTFGRKAGLIRHEVVHDPNSAYSCTDCEKVYKNQVDLRKHYKREHLGEGSFQHSCSICNKKFHRKDMLRMHQVKSGHYMPGTSSSSRTHADDQIEVPPVSDSFQGFSF